MTADSTKPHSPTCLSRAEAPSGAAMASRCPERGVAGRETHTPFPIGPAPHRGALPAAPFPPATPRRPGAEGSAPPGRSAGPPRYLVPTVRQSLSVHPGRERRSAQVLSAKSPGKKSAPLASVSSIGAGASAAARCAACLGLAARRRGPLSLFLTSSRSARPPPLGPRRHWPPAPGAPPRDQRAGRDRRGQELGRGLVARLPSPLSVTAGACRGLPAGRAPGRARWVPGRIGRVVAACPPSSTDPPSIHRRFQREFKWPSCPSGSGFFGIAKKA